MNVIVIQIWLAIGTYHFYIGTQVIVTPYKTLDIQKEEENKMLKTGKRKMTFIELNSIMAGWYVVILIDQSDTCTLLFATPYKTLGTKKGGN